MSQTNAIILRIHAPDADEFEAGFREHELPLWDEYVERGLFERVSLTRVQYGTHQTDGIVNFLVVAVVRDMAAHNEHDNDPRFEAWNTMADRYQPEEPLVFGGDTLIHRGG